MLLLLAYYGLCRKRSGPATLQPDLTYAGTKTIEFFVGSPSKGQRSKRASLKQKFASMKHSGTNDIDKLQSHILRLEKQITTKNKQCLNLIQQQQSNISTIRQLSICQQMINVSNEQQSVVLEKAISENVRNILVNLPPNSPLCRPLLSGLIKGLSQEDAQRYFSMSKRSYKRVDEADESYLYSIKYKLKVKRERHQPEAMSLLAELADEQVKLNFYCN